MKPIDRTRILNRIRKRLFECHSNQIELANDSGVAKDNLSRIENKENL